MRALLAVLVAAPLALAGPPAYADDTPPVPVVEVPWPVVLTTAVDVYAGAVEKESGVASVDIRYRRVHYTGLTGAYVHPAGWQGVADGTRPLSGLRRGYTYCFSARATDGAGNTSGWSPDRCSTVALDDRALSASSGWTRGESDVHYLRTYTRTTQRGRTLAVSGVRTGRVVLVATKCPTCGVVGVYVGGALVSRLDLSLPYTEHQVVINQGWFGARDGTVTLKALSPGEPVRIDGVAFSSVRY